MPNTQDMVYRRLNTPVGKVFSNKLKLKKITNYNYKKPLIKEN